jgi:peptidylprolyl isomerase
MKLRVTALFLLAASLHAESVAVLAKVGDIEVQAAEIREIIAGLDDAQQAAISKDPAALGQYVRALLVQRLVLKQALDAKWDQDPAVISRLVRAREAALTESYLQHNSAPNPDYPSETDLTVAYESAKSKLLIPRSYRLAQIFIASDKAKLDATVKRLKAKGADFTAIARNTSEESASAAQGGEIGWLTEEQIQPEIREKLPKLTLGALSDPIKLNDGWHILKVLDVREPRTPTLAEVRPELVAQLRAEHSRNKRQEFLAGLLKQHPLAINEIELSKLLPQP